MTRPRTTVTTVRILPHLSMVSSFWARDVCSVSTPCMTCRLSSSFLASVCRHMNSVSTPRARAIQTTSNGNRMGFINDLHIPASQPNLRARAGGRASRQWANAGFVEGPAGGFFGGGRRQEQIRIEGRLALLANFAGAIPPLFLTHRTDVAPDGLNVLVNVVAVDRLNGLDHLREKTEQRATGGALQAALALGGPLRAHTADPVPDNGL